MNDIIWLARFSLSLINITLLIILIFIFTRRYNDIKSTFNLGFLLIALSLFLRTFFSSPIVRFYLTHSEVHSIVDPYRLVADVFELLALSVFLYITLK